METVNIKINGRDYVVPKGSTVLEAAKAAKLAAKAAKEASKAE